MYWRVDGADIGSVQYEFTHSLRPRGKTMDRPAAAQPGGARSGRAVHRTFGAAVVAGGLALSVSIQPLPAGQGLIDSLIPGRQSSAGTPRVTGWTFMKATASEFATLDLTHLARLAEFSEQYPGLATSDLLGLVTRYGLRNVVNSFEMLASLEPVRRLVGGVPYGGGGSNFPPDVGGAETFRALMMLLEFLEVNPPSGPGLFRVLMKVAVTLTHSTDIPPTLPAPPPGQQTASLAALAQMTVANLPSAVPPAPVAAPARVADPAPADPVVANSPEPPAATFADLPVAEPTVVEEPTSTDVHDAATDDPTPASPEPTGTAAEPSNSSRPEPDPDPRKEDPPKPDPPSSSGGGTDDGGSSAGSESSAGSSNGGSAGGDSSGSE